jgi:hypothetical protein
MGSGDELLGDVGSDARQLGQYLRRYVVDVHQAAVVELAW